MLELLKSKILVSDGAIGTELLKLSSEKNPEDISKIFKPFPKIKSHLNGSGLGLALAKCFVELHGGKITVSSEYQVGTEFKVILPLDSGHNCLKKEEVKKYEVI